MGQINTNNYPAVSSLADADLLIVENATHGTGTTTPKQLRENAIGTDPLQTTAQTVTGAINELKNSGGLPENPLSITHGGTGNSAGYIQTGRSTQSALGTGATIEGHNNTGAGTYCHAEGHDNSCGANASYSHAEGQSNNVSGIASHAEGYACNVSGNYSHAGGYYNTVGYQNQTALGKYNNNKSGTLLEVGNGTGTSARSNAFEVYSDGKISCDNGSSKFQFTQSSGVDGYYDASGTFHAFGGSGSGVSDVSWDTTNKKLKQTKNGTTTDIVTGATILNGLTSSQVTNALGYTPPQQDTNTHRPIKMNGSQILGDNTTALDLVAGTNITLTNSGGAVTIAATGGSGGGDTVSKSRYSISYSSWSSSTNSDGYYTLSKSLSPSLSSSPNVYIAGSSNTSQPTDTHKSMYALVERCALSASGATLTLYAKTKPTSSFYIWVEGEEGTASANYVGNVVKPNEISTTNVKTTTLSLDLSQLTWYQQGDAYYTLGIDTGVTGQIITFIRTTGWTNVLGQYIDLVIYERGYTSSGDGGKFGLVSNKGSFASGSTVGWLISYI